MKEKEDDLLREFVKQSRNKMYDNKYTKINELDEAQPSDNQGGANQSNQPKDGTAIDKKTEIGFFSNAMKDNGIYTNMKFNDVKIYSDYVEFSGEVPTRNNTINWLVQKDCSVSFAKPLIFGSLQKGQTQTLNYDIDDVFEVTNELNSVVKAINEYFNTLKERLPDYLSDKN